jgi:hypothetical protein
VLLRISSCFSWISKNSVPYRIFRISTLSCSEGKGHTFESCRVSPLKPDYPMKTPRRPFIRHRHLSFYLLPEWSHPVNAQGDPKIHDWRPQPRPQLSSSGLTRLIQYSRCP